MEFAGMDVNERDKLYSDTRHLISSLRNLGFGTAADTVTKLLEAWLDQNSSVSFMEYKRWHEEWLRLREGSTT